MAILAMLGTIVTLVFAVILILFVLTSVLKGLSKGFIHTAVKTVFIFVSGLLALFISVPLGKTIARVLVSKLTSIISGMWSGYDELVAASPSIEGLITGIPAVIISVILYVVLFLVLSLIMLIPARLIRKHVFERFLPNFPKLRWAGALCGVIAGLASFVFIMAPLTGTLAMVGDAASIVTVAAGKKEDKKIDVYEDVIEPVTDNFFVKLTSNLGGRAIYNHLTSFDVNGEKVSVSNEFSVLGDVFSAIKPILGGKSESWTREDIDAIGSAADRLSDSELVSGVLADILSAAGNKWSEDEAFLGLKVPSVGNESTGDFLKEFLVSFKSTTKETVGEDIGTLADVLGVLHDYGMLSAKQDGESAGDKISTEGFVSELLGTVMKNERFRGTAAAVINLGVSQTLDILDVPATDSEVYDNFVADIAGIINASDDDEKVKQDVYDSFTEHGIKTDKNITDRVAEYLEQDFAGRTDVSPEEIGSFFGVAFAIKEETEEVSFRSVFPGVSFINDTSSAGARALNAFLKANKDIAGASLDALSTLISRDDFESTVVTAEKLKVTRERIEALADEIIDTECERIENIINKFMSFSNSSKDGDVVESADIASLGGALNEIGKSEMLSEISDDMIRAAFGSKLVKDNIRISNDTVEKMVTSEETDYEDILVSVQKTTNIINGLSKEEGEKISDEEVDEKLDYLLSDMSQNTAEVIGEVFDSKNVQKLGIEEEKSEKIAASLGVFFDKMAKSDADTSDPEDKDVKASKTVFKFIAASKTSNPDLFAETGLTPNETINIFMDSEISRETIIEASYKDGKIELDSFGLASKMNDESRNEALETMEAHVKANYGSAEDKEEYKNAVLSIGAILGMDVSGEFNSWTK